MPVLDKKKNTVKFLIAIIIPEILWFYWTVTSYQVSNWEWPCVLHSHVYLAIILIVS